MATSQDPLIAALPPNTDYITYLTILEYQLTPKNLSTLNQLLQEDDGTLAAEIGWDLLKLVLPILRVEPGKAKECLDIISRRGNPREVIVRVSEELETLGINESDDNASPIDHNDGLPTFAGEAPRVHLGDMTLKGMPPPIPTQRQVEENLAEEDQDTPDAAVEELKLQSLLSMLSSLHPRIKTQYPSRFLATSLPAALGAYRRLSMNADSTLAFLNTLKKLSGNNRPNLPPRIPTAELLKQTSTSSDPTRVTSALLPDPESKSGPVASAGEGAINQRLLQAVLLEIVEEHTAASAEAQPPLTAHLRGLYQPLTISSSRKRDLDILTTSREAVSAHDIRTKFLAVSKSLKLDVEAEIARALEPPAENDEAQEEHEYPTSPSQIPFAYTGLLLLYSAYMFNEAISQTISQPLSASRVHTNTILQLICSQYAIDARLRQSTPALDSILSLIYTVIYIQSSHQTVASQSQSGVTTSEPVLLATFSLLKDIFITCPDPDLRDNAHHISTHIFHTHFSPATRIAIVKDLLTTSSFEQPISPIHEAQTGNLKAIVVAWLKDELYPSLATVQSYSSQQSRGLPASVLIDLSHLLFSTDAIEAIPQPSNTTEVDTENFASNLPFYISTLNLLCIFTQTQNNRPDQPEITITNPDSTSTPADSAEDQSSITTTTDILPQSTITPYLNKLSEWSSYLTDRLTQPSKTLISTTSEPETELDGVSIGDIFALEDAVGRTKEALASA